MSCSICVCDLLEPPEGSPTNEITALECKHVFHSICIDKALEARGLCPVCRATVLLERTIQLRLGKPLDLEELRMTQSTMMTQSIRSETRFSVDALMKRLNALERELKEQKEETETYNEICDLLEEEYKEKAAETQRSSQAISKIRKKTDVLDEKRREFDQSPQDSLTVGYRNWLLNEDTGREERRLRAMGVAEKSKEERKRLLEKKHCKISQALVNIEETIIRHKEDEQWAKEAEEKATLRLSQVEKRHASLLAQALELGLSEQDIPKRKKRKAPIDVCRSSSFDLGSVVDVSYDDDRSAVPVDDDAFESQHGVFGYQHDLDMDTFGYDCAVPSKAAKTEKVSSSGGLEGRYISKVYSQNTDKAPKKQRDFLRLFT